jgi:hypothetical protein
MQTWTVVTIIGAVGTVMCAAVTWIQASRLAKLNNQANVELEKLRASNTQLIEEAKGRQARELEVVKAQNHNLIKAYEQAGRETAELEASLVTAWRTIQKTKETLRDPTYVSSHPNGVDSEHENTLRPIEDALEKHFLEIRETYRIVGPTIPHEARKVLHEARDAVHRAYFLIRVARQSDLSPDDRNKAWNNLVGFPDKLTLAQNRLLEIKDQLREQRMLEILRQWEQR